MQRDADVALSGSDALPREARDPQRLAELAEELRIGAQVERLLAALALPEQVRVAGASFTGVGIPDCVNAGRVAARAVVGQLG